MRYRTLVNLGSAAVLAAAFALSPQQGPGVAHGTTVLAAPSVTHSAVQPQDDNEDYAQQSCGGNPSGTPFGTNWSEVTSVTVGKAEDSEDVMPMTIRPNDGEDVVNVPTDFWFLGDVTYGASLNGASLQAALSVDNAGPGGGTNVGGYTAGLTKRYPFQGATVTVPKDGSHTIHAWVRVVSPIPSDQGPIGNFCLTTSAPAEED
jgi:hypothetical protein